jgi:tetratricopeptide (TPR) repeat protein
MSCRAAIGFLCTPALLLLLMAHGRTAAAATAADVRVAETLAAATQRCTQLAELVSCDAALSMQPNDADLLVAEADVLVQLKRPGEAIGVYRNALRAGAQDDVVKQKIASGQLQRQSLVKTCMTQAGDIGVRACESAWLPGAPDEVAMFKRRGLLMQDESPSAALEAYMSAARLAPRDRDVARAVVALSGSLDAQGAGILTARGAAFMTLHRPKDAAVPLRQAVNLAPELVEARNLLRQAEAGIKEPSASTSGGNGEVSDTPAPAIRASVPADLNRAFSNEAPATHTY